MSTTTADQLGRTADQLEPSDSSAAGELAAHASAGAGSRSRCCASVS